MVAIFGSQPKDARSSRVGSIYGKVAELVDCVRPESGMSEMAHGFKSHPCRMAGWQSWSIAQALNTCELKGSVGSNPTPVV